VFRESGCPDRETTVRPGDIRKKCNDRQQYSQGRHAQCLMPGTVGVVDEDHDPIELTAVVVCERPLNSLFSAHTELSHCSIHGIGALPQVAGRIAQTASDAGVTVS
jgi:hypothetical protein